MEHNLPRDFASPIQHVDSRCITNLLLAQPPHLGNILPLLQHTKRLPKRQIADNIEGQVIKPMQGIHAVELPFGNRSSALVPLLLELLKVVVDILFKLADGFSREGMRDSFAFPRMFSAVTRIEKAAADRDEGVVVLAVLV
jgi:hypothetical protein